MSSPNAEARVLLHDSCLPPSSIASWWTVTQISPTVFQLWQQLPRQAELNKHTKEEEARGHRETLKAYHLLSGCNLLFPNVSLHFMAGIGENKYILVLICWVAFAGFQGQVCLNS